MRGTISVTTSTVHSSDHPRACGELLRNAQEKWTPYGSSPRMRGTLDLRFWCKEVERIIPAHAGNSGPLTPRPFCRTDHPRACGELRSEGKQRSSQVGSSPRMRGTPRVSQIRVLVHRIIPAHAGNSHECCGRICADPDHPRACGELCSVACCSGRFAGSSPRMRGTHPRDSSRAFYTRIIPAHAGNSPV